MLSDEITYTLGKLSKKIGVFERLFVETGK